jgi:hypothetical protein
MLAAPRSQNPDGELKMKQAEKIEVRRDAVARAPYALLAALDAAMSLGASNAVDADGDPHRVEAQDKFGEAQMLAIETLAVVVKEAESFRAMSERPQTIIEAMNVVAGAQKAFSLAVDSYLTRLEVWRRAEAQGARIRVAVTERLQLAPDQGGKALSASAADKAASGDPEYTQHKDAVADLADLKDAYEFEMKVAEQNVHGAIVVLEAFTALQRSNTSPALTAATEAIRS